MKYSSIVFLAVLWMGSPDVSQATTESNNSSLSDQELSAIRDGFSARAEEMVATLAGEPFVPADIRPPLGPARGRYARHYGYSVTNFAMKAFLLDEQLDEANRALQEYGQFYINDPATRNDRDSFYWPVDVVCRIIEFFGSNGSHSPGKLTTQTEDILLEMAWHYSKETSRIEDAETALSKTWHVYESENHHLQRFSTVWHFSKFLSKDDRYKHRPYDDGKTASEHYRAWSEYSKEYLAERARKGLFVEIANTGYGLQSIKGIYSFFDFAEDRLLKQRAGMFLDLFWASWAEEQIDGIRGGGMTRIYQGLSSQAPGKRLGNLTWYYLGYGDVSPPSGNAFSIITSEYRMPLVVMDMALDTNGRGNYEITQRRMGLAEDGFYTPPEYRLRTGFGGILRYSFCTPEFILGTLICEARPLEDWTMISSQNRWHGVIFAGHPDARIYPQCHGDELEKTYNQQWSVQRKGTLIAQRLAMGEFSRTPDAMRVWFSRPGLANRHERQGWVFVEADSAYAAVCPVDGGYQWRTATGDIDGDWLRCFNSLTPVILEVATKRKFTDYREFQDRVLASELSFENSTLRYTGLDGDQFTFYSDYSRAPMINGQEVDYAPARVFDSPFIRSDWNSGIVTIRKGHRIHSLDFNRTQL